jgi:hypothetical protein
MEMPNTILPPVDNSVHVGVLVGVLQEISGKLSVLEEIKASVNTLERRLGRERLDRQEFGSERSAPIDIAQKGHTSSRREDPEEIDDDIDSESKYKVVTSALPSSECG